MVETAPANVSIVVLGPETFAAHARRHIVPAGMPTAHPTVYLGRLLCIAHVEAPENLAHYFVTHRGDYLPVAASHLPAPQPKDTE